MPLLTFTSPHGLDHVEHTRPSEAYLSMVRDGLRESRGWDDKQISTYLSEIITARSRRLSPAAADAEPWPTQGSVRRSRRSLRTGSST